jgi:hypothetical protein
LEEVRDVLSRGGSFLDDCQAPFTALTRDASFVPDVVAFEMATLRTRPGYDVPRATEQLLPLAHAAYGRLGLRLVEPSPTEPPPPRTLHGLLRDAFIGVFGPGGARIETFVEDPPGRALRRAAVEEIRSGDVRRFTAGRDLVHAYSGKTASVWLTFVSGTEADACWIYDYPTLAAVRKQASTLATTRLEAAARLVTELGYSPAAEALAGLCEHPAHYVRWGALRQLARLDPKRALELLRRAKDDPHPHVRNAAAAALVRFQGEAR